MTGKIITISREFGSGGRELGKRLADELGFSYFDKEIVTEISNRMQMDENYVSNALDKGVFLGIPIHVGHTFGYMSPQLQHKADLIVEASNLLRELAEKGNCVIVGRAASAILTEYTPFNIFVHADISHRVMRCQTHAREDENYTDEQMKEKIINIDADRAKYYKNFSPIPWGDKSGYHLCINSTGTEIKALVPSVADYIRSYYK